MTRLRRLTPTICAFHLGFSLGTNVHDADPRERADECTARDVLLLLAPERRHAKKPATVPSLGGIVWP